MKASRPPAIHVERNSSALGTAAATLGGVKRMPPPITFETMIAAASKGPSRRSSSGSRAVSGAGSTAERASGTRVVGGRHPGSLLGQQLAVNLLLGELHPRARAV